MYSHTSNQNFMVREQAVTAGLFAQEASNLTARELFLPEKYPSPITTDRVSQAGGISGSGIVDSQSKEPRPTPPSYVLNCAERAPKIG